MKITKNKNSSVIIYFKLLKIIKQSIFMFSPFLMSSALLVI